MCRCAVCKCVLSQLWRFKVGFYALVLLVCHNNAQQKRKFKWIKNWNRHIFSSHRCWVFLFSFESLYLFALLQEWMYHLGHLYTTYMYIRMYSTCKHFWLLCLGVFLSLFLCFSSFSFFSVLVWVLFCFALFYEFMQHRCMLCVMLFICLVDSWEERKKITLLHRRPYMMAHKLSPYFSVRL